MTLNFDSPFIRDGEDKLIRRSYGWDDRTLVMVMVNGIGAMGLPRFRGEGEVLGSRYLI
jgi:hypothetical protein